MAQVTLKDIIFDAYAQALLAARQKGLQGEPAKEAARNAAARVVSKATGKVVTPEIVLKAVTDL
ncbi:conserved hypothetical protein [Azospirillaceae bacterium]